jgi:hypothetical protein
MASASELVKRALRLLGVTASGENPSGAEIADGFAALNDMLETWRLDRHLVYSIDRQVFTDIVAGTAVYTIGTGATWAIDRPIRIERASWIDNSNSSDPLEIPLRIVNYEEWQSIPIKTTGSNYPYYLYYEPEVTNGKIYLFPEPDDATMDLVIYVWNPLNAIASSGDDVTFPPGYQRALIYNLAVELSAEYGRIPPQIIIDKAEEARDAIAFVNIPSANVYTEKAALGSGNDNTWDYRSGEFFSVR